MIKEKKQPTLLDALIPVFALIIMLAGSVYLYGDNSSYGANQIALILAASIAILVGYKNGYSWTELEAGIVKGISMALGAILILLMVGSLIGTWILAGTVPTMIYYGLNILDPSIFYAATCIVCALVSVSIGSSWTTAGTVGVALIGIASGLDLSLEITAGAIISGAYFGDKMSPLSDTTNLAPAIAGTELFTHIRHMAWTTGPSILLAIIIFTIIGFTEDTTANEQGLADVLSAIESNFTVSFFALIPLFAVLFMAYKKMPAFPTLLIGALLGGLFAAIFQPQSINKFVESSRYTCEVKDSNFKSCSVAEYHYDGGEFVIELEAEDGKKHPLDFKIGSSLEMFGGEATFTVEGKDIPVKFISRSYIVSAIDAVWRSMAAGFTAKTGNEQVDKLLSRGGMESMLNPTVWLILCAMAFGAVLETIGLLQRLVKSALSLANSTGSLITTVIGTCIGTNIIAADQYIAIVLPGRMYRAEFKRRKLHPKNLSRVLEDSATITSPLIPWNTCGAYMAGTLGVATLAYLPFCFFNLANPIVSIIYGITHFKIEKLDENSEGVVEPVVEESK